MDGPLYRDTVVIGVGNTILSDDGVGVHAARLLQLDARVPPGVTILDGGTIGLELVPYASDASRVLLLDAMNSGQAPGTLARMTGRELLGRASAWSVHQLGVADLVAALLLVSRHPQDVVVLGIQPASTDWGTGLSPAVDAAVRSLVNAALAQLNVWHESRAGGSKNRAFPPGPSSDRAVREPRKKGAR
ncbi:MAG: HyaD/HybD family hydrogenase maturation endopeptidase [Candidatus Acidiferrales bacterium]